MFKRMSGKRCVVCLDVELEVVDEIEFSEEGEGGCSIGIVLVLGRFRGFWFNEELSLEADLLLVIDRHLEEPSHLLLLSFQIRAEERLVSFPSAPKHVVLSAKFFG